MEVIGISNLEMTAIFIFFAHEMAFDVSKVIAVHNSIYQSVARGTLTLTVNHFSLPCPSIKN